ncbi:hypothetical protein VP01_3025g2 [Puccinia sorghi]|uniref:Uncharacterized protein n=1 Tax=Puccinia sorghi TaxID=27349 RepID=A0A0L6V1Y3_9BASI|nr:hypothetical protein VP01_3025g2 [Puccinia sorghi]
MSCFFFVLSGMLSCLFFFISPFFFSIYPGHFKVLANFSSTILHIITAQLSPLSSSLLYQKYTMKNRVIPAFIKSQHSDSTWHNHWIPQLCLNRKETKPKIIQVITSFLRMSQQSPANKIKLADLRFFFWEFSHPARFDVFVFIKIEVFTQTQFMATCHTKLFVFLVKKHFHTSQTRIIKQNKINAWSLMANNIMYKANGHTGLRQLHPLLGLAWALLIATFTQVYTSEYSPPTFRGVLPKPFSFHLPGILLLQDHHLWLSQLYQVLAIYFSTLFPIPIIPLCWYLLFPNPSVYQVFGLEGIYLLPYTPSVVFVTVLGLFFDSTTASYTELTAEVGGNLCVDFKLKNQPDLFPKSSCYHPSNMLHFTCSKILIYLLLIKFFGKLYLNSKILTYFLS